MQQDVNSQYFYANGLPKRLISVAPMLDWTDRHDRYFLRLLSKNCWLYSEMVTTGAIIYGDKQRHLDFSECEQPIALQLGGSDPQDLAKCAKLGEAWGYNEINLNVGCPSDRVQSGAFGACLMAKPQLVSDCIKSMRDVVDIDVTVKHRIGIDDLDSYQLLCDFVGKVAESGCETFIVHGRKAILGGLSPKENRDIPPLKYDTVLQLKKDFPHLEIILNGGIQDLEQAKPFIGPLDGVMIGRAAYQSPWILSQCDSQIYGGEDQGYSRAQIIEKMLPYIDQHLARGGKLKHISRHLLGLFQGIPGARKWRRMISENAHLPQSNGKLLVDALDHVR
ncbi:tRNA dihydrouridine(20/20a) synthase DusA [Pelagibaculum spongiae]|uniref:tRNA-dihydrouridine(20/20a) synthase n=1 Tax=Pelagibaculum spongiae TaxID=2080658 RepID=A0A2V1H2K5_9GAMM|nr:tRNA dihydrouridine(20/20a) synthase DusA [Pelagibaculum spongiae]PVZ69527.1 tRNA dihydrouridine(20/20a) synthase DusA [Pelagibaculum spongiae]